MTLQKWSPCQSKGPIPWDKEIRYNWATIYRYWCHIYIYWRRQMEIGTVLAADKSCRIVLQFQLLATNVLATSVQWKDKHHWSAHQFIWSRKSISTKQKNCGSGTFCAPPPPQDRVTFRNTLLKIGPPPVL